MTPVRSLRSAGEDLRSLAFDLHPTPTLVAGDDGFLCAANEAAETVFGRAMGLLTRKRLRDCFPDGAVLPDTVERARREQMIVREKGADISLPDLPLHGADITAVPMPDGRVLLSLGLRPTADIERTKDTLRSVAGMGRTLAHEVKNPLAGIRGAAQLLGSGGACAEDVALAQLIVDETDRIRRLIDRVEAFADDRPLERRPVNIHRVLDRVRALMTASVGQSVTFREAFDPSLPHAFGDEDQLIQVFLNLVKNAAEAAKSRGDDRGDVLIATSFRQGFRAAPLEIRVLDNGPGVPPDLRERLFDPFVTTKPQGAGLGLTLVAKLVAAQNGLIDFDSEPGRTVFRVLLPIAPASIVNHVP